MKQDNRGRIEPYLACLFGYAVNLAGDREDARDLVQDCALKALSARSVPRDDTCYRAWLFRILRNAHIDRLRRERFRGAGCDPAPDLEEAQACRGDESLISGLTVRLGMARLTPAHREILALVDIAGFCYTEAAALLEIPLGTVMSRMSRARRALLQAIAEGNVRSLDAVRQRRTGR